MPPKFSVSGFIAGLNQSLEYTYPTVEVEGEVASFKVNQSKYVFFDIKDDTSSVNCFMTVWQLRAPIEDGMKVIVTATPKVTNWGKFSLTVRAVRPSGEGSLKKSFELLRAKLEGEGLFAQERKRPLPSLPTHIGVISSTGAAGYADFIKILGDRWGGIRVDVAQVQVQGVDAPDQMIRALRYFNTRENLPEVLVLIRGGGSADDLSAYNDEMLVREIAASRIPTLVGVGHETDESLADMVADLRAATPSNAAQLLVPDKTVMQQAVRAQLRSVLPRVERGIQTTQDTIHRQLREMIVAMERKMVERETALRSLRQILHQLDPKRPLERGYALIRGDIVVGGTIEIETKRHAIAADITDITEKA